jgi:hypothetical protein
VIGMKRKILATAFLLASAAFASADYVIIVANVGGESDKQLTTPGMNMRGGPGMNGPMPGGMAGMNGPMPGGMAGKNGPMPAMPGGMPPNMGMAGGPMPGMGGKMGMAGGMPGMRGGMMGGMMGGNVSALDDNPDYVFAVVQVKSKAKRFADEFNKGMPLTVVLPKTLGESCKLMKETPKVKAYIIARSTGSKEEAIPTVLETFNAKFAEIKDSSPAVDILRLAEWTLTHGLVDKFPVVMDKLVALDKTHPAALAYQAIKTELDRKPSDDPDVAAWRDKLLPRFKTMESPHYLILHNAARDDALVVATHRDHLENTLRGFYYWFALKEKERDPKNRKMPAVPRYRQVVVLTTATNNFEQLHKILSSCPVVVDGFFARRENMTVMNSRRQDDKYLSLVNFWEPRKAKGYEREYLLQGGKSGYPKTGIPKNLPKESIDTIESQMLALMLKAMEQEAELATVSHDASRQLLFSSGLLTRKVAVPEWILFGMGSFFETPLQAPWPTLGGLSPYYLPRWRELKNKAYEKKRVDTLRKVVTDAYFRAVPPDGKSESPERKAHDDALRNARTAAWSLTYYLAQQKLDGLHRYFAELNKMPRDIELDETTLLDCFARAFGCVDSNNKVDNDKLAKLANSWNSFMETEKFESEETIKAILKKIKEETDKAKEEADKRNNANNNGQFPGGFGPGGPGGFNPGGPGGMNPRGPQGFPPQGGGGRGNGGGGGGGRGNGGGGGGRRPGQ